MIACVEAPLALLEKPIKVILLDAVKFTHVALGLVPEILDTIDVIMLIGKQLEVSDTVMPELGDIQRIVARQRIGIHHTFGDHFFLNDGQQRLGFGVGNNRRIDFATAL